MSKVRAWIESFRLRTLPLSLSGVILAGLLAYGNNKFSTPTFIFSISTTLFLQILSNLANDLGDSLKGTDNADRKGPLRAVQSGIISIKEMKTMIIIFITLSIISGLSLIHVSFGSLFSTEGKLMIFMGAMAIIAALKYTLGHKPYGYQGLGDIFVFIFFGLVSVCGTYYLYASEIPLIVLLPSISIGLLSVGVLNMNNIRDIKNDKISGKLTIPVTLGEKKAKIYHFAVIITAIAVLIADSLIEYNSIYDFTYCIAFFPLLVHLNKVRQYSEEQLDGQLKVISLSTLIIAVLFGISRMM